MQVPPPGPSEEPSLSTPDFGLRASRAMREDIPVLGGPPRLWPCYSSLRTYYTHVSFRGGFPVSLVCGTCWGPQ